MILDRYDLTVANSLLNYDFVSEGPKGKIQKVVEYEKTNIEGLFNLAFGDKDLQTGGINDTSVSNNGDGEKVLATVASTLYFFAIKYPNTWIRISGSTDSRTRLYKMGIAKYLHEIQDDFEIYGQVGKNWEPFKKDGTYSAFAVKRKN